MITAILYYHYVIGIILKHAKISQNKSLCIDVCPHLVGVQVAYEFTCHTHTQQMVDKLHKYT